MTWGAEAGSEYRRRKSVLRAALGPGLRDLAAGEAVAGVLDAARSALVPVGRAFDEAARAGRLSEAPSSIYRSLVHLHCNRLLGTDRGDERFALALARRARESLDRYPAGSR